MNYKKIIAAVLLWGILMLISLFVKPLWLAMTIGVLLTTSIPIIRMYIEVRK